MRKLILIKSSLVALMFIASNFVTAQEIKLNDTLYIATWNVENLFDTDDDTLTNDSEFLPGSEKDWTEERLETKLKNLTHVINFMNNGCGPDVIGFQEVENISVLKRLMYKMPSRDYIIAHRDSPDERGIDACLMYDRSVFDIEEIVPIEVKIPSGYKTRDILHVVLTHRESKTKVHFFVNHWPSRRGGEAESEKNRIAAAQILRNNVDSLQQDEDDKQIIILGDFNDEPNNKSIDSVLNAKNYLCGESKSDDNELLNLSYKLFSEGFGTYQYKSDWNMLDQIIVSQDFVDGKNIEYKYGSFEIIKPEFMLIKSGSKKGAPSGTYGGNKYYGGYSDHFPVGIEIYYNNNKSN